MHGIGGALIGRQGLAALGVDGGDGSEPCFAFAVDGQGQDCAALPLFVEGGPAVRAQGRFVLLTGDARQEATQVVCHELLGLRELFWGGLLGGTGGGQEQGQGEMAHGGEYA